MESPSTDERSRWRSTSRRVVVPVAPGQGVVPGAAPGLVLAPGDQDLAVVQLGLPDQGQGDLLDPSLDHTVLRRRRRGADPALEAPLDPREAREVAIMTPLLRVIAMATERPPRTGNQIREMTRVEIMLRIRKPILIRTIVIDGITNHKFDPSPHIHTQLAPRISHEERKENISLPIPPTLFSYLLFNIHYH